MTLAVVIVAYGSPALLAAALAPLEGLPTVVVDNSGDTAVEAVVRAAGASYVDPGSNLGFAAGANRGVAAVRDQAGPADVLLLNPDAVLARADVERLHAALHSEQRLAAVAPRLQHPDGTPQRVAWPFPSPRRMWIEAVGLGRLNDRHPDWLVGAVLLVRAEAWDDVGPFDERFFLYQEETDWQRRAVSRGWRLRVVPEVVAQHVGAATSTDVLRREALFHAGTETYVRKWFGDGGWRLYRAAALAGASARGMLLQGPARAGARRRLGLYRAGPRAAAGLETAASSSASSTSSAERRQE